VHRGNRHPAWAPQGVYPCQGEQQWLALSVRTDAEWQALCDVIGASEHAALSIEERRVRHDEIDERISAWSQTQDAQPAQDALQARGIPAARMLDSDSVHWDGHLLARDTWDFMKHPRMQPYPQPAPPWRLTEANPRPRRPAPMFGEHNREILCGLLGVSEAELEELAEAGVIANAPVGAGVG
jgi:crotonobetainyl-CoA:carnitine CoA-transferase CaiB-like acyl-CoA transferase